MNELGEVSESAHIEVGQYCDPSKLSLLITIGEDSEKYIASEAKKRGVNVKSFNSPIEAGKYLKELIKPNSVILVKGSQNRVFAEEAIKYILDNKADAKKLVSQSDYWLNIKRKQFKY